MFQENLDFIEPTCFVKMTLEEIYIKLPLLT